MLLRTFLYFFIFSTVFTAAAQPVFFKIGLGLDFGSHVKRIGLRSEVSYSLYFVELNSNLGCYYNFKSFGVQEKTPELQFGLGSSFGFGTKGEIPEYFFDSKLNNSSYPYALSYHYQIYLDKQNTSQTTGTIGLHIKHFSILTENDLLGAGKGWRDRFRTGALAINYRYKAYFFSIKNIMYTGDFASATKVLDSDYPARFGYRSADKAIHADRSVGLLSFTFSYALPYHQIVGLSVGLDSEKIRHQLQNEWMHDMIFYTDKMVKRKLMHIPMLQDNGSQFLYQNGEEIKPGRLYYNLGINPMLFY
ncbi:hypothetical protein DNU06_11885 [Putridiphycobacter roseus]|uniref:Bacterial toxin 23 domain-containing protein n=1 Tax=Putridiphycobacter roseus TaxID=2219161 RepID=A0A2W1MZ71_9FLAO|nr:polymorphic toxin type 23 domain-containing protein [Putridiphycobacter roseus]PZE16550.1 hypothetical protein DNU06_11885 [Putridiphycobacter roseus]